MCAFLSFCRGITCHLVQHNWHFFCLPFNCNRITDKSCYSFTTVVWAHETDEISVIKKALNENGNYGCVVVSLRLKGKIIFNENDINVWSVVLRQLLVLFMLFALFYNLIFHVPVFHHIGMVWQLWELLWFIRDRTAMAAFCLLNSETKSMKSIIWRET